MSKSTTERRAYARYPRTFELEGTLPVEGKVVRMVATNLSIGGLYCTSSVGFDEMTRLAVRLMLPLRRGGPKKVQPLDLEGIVVRRRPLSSAPRDERYELALLFTRLDDAQRRRIAQYLSG